MQYYPNSYLILDENHSYFLYGDPMENIEKIKENSCVVLEQGIKPWSNELRNAFTEAEISYKELDFTANDEERSVLYNPMCHISSHIQAAELARTIIWEKELDKMPLEKQKAMEVILTAIISATKFYANGRNNLNEIANCIWGMALNDFRTMENIFANVPKSSTTYYKYKGFLMLPKTEKHEIATVLYQKTNVFLTDISESISENIEKTNQDDVHMTKLVDRPQHYILQLEEGGSAYDVFADMFLTQIKDMQIREKTLDAYIAQKKSQFA